VKIILGVLVAVGLLPLGPARLPEDPANVAQRSGADAGLEETLRSGSRLLRRRLEMKTILGSRKQQYLRRGAVLLVALALIAGLAGCDGASVRYEISISSSEGGAVTTPGEGTRSYDAGTVLNLVATADGGYRFANWTGNVGTIADVNAAATTITLNGNCSITANFEPDYKAMVSGGGAHTAGLRSDGTVVAAGDDSHGQCAVDGWTDIVEVAAGVGHTVGLKPGGTVVAVGDNTYGQCNVGNWTDLVQVAAGGYHTVGLKPDGTLVAVGWNDYGQCDVGTLTDIAHVAAGTQHTVGLKSDGTVVAVGDGTPTGSATWAGWTDIVQVAAGAYPHGRAQVRRHRGRRGVDTR
jgi:hypothetical protein